MHDRLKRILIAGGVGILVAIVNNRLDLVFAHLAMPPASTFVNDLIIGCIAALCAYAWASMSAQRNEHQALQEKSRQKDLLRERTRVACEIHDTLAQGFAAIIRHLEAAHDPLVSPAEARSSTERALNIGRESLAEARLLLQDLRSPSQESEGVRGSITRLTETLAHPEGLRTQVWVEGDFQALSIETETELLRIIREAITNTARHAKASEIRVALLDTGKGLQLCIEDNGCGFRLGDLGSLQGFGLTSMHERARNLGGVLWVYSQPGQGTQIVAVIPATSKSDSRSSSWGPKILFESSSRMTIRSSARD